MKENVKNSNLELITTKKERLGYYSYFVGQNMIFFLQLLFVAVYFTSELGIPPATVGVILLVARIWDAVNDPLLSIMVEKANLRNGKFLPWIKAVVILMPIFTVLIFSFTNVLVDMSLSARVAYASITYILWGMIYTISDAPAFALSTVMTEEIDERNGILSFARFAAMIGILFFIILSMVLKDATPFIVALITSMIALVFLLGIYTVKEHVKSDVSSPTLMQIVNAIVKNKYLVIFVITSVVFSATNFGMVLAPFLALDIFNNDTLIGILMLAMILPTLIVAPLMPKLIKKFGKIFLYNTVLISTIIFGIIMYVVGYSNLSVFIGLSFIKGIFGAPLLVIGSLFFADCIEYALYTRGDRFEAATFSAQTFSAKVIGALSAALAMFLLGMIGYQESTGEEVVKQSQDVLDGMWTIYNLGPIVGAVLALIIFNTLYKLTDAKVKEMAEANKSKLQIK